MKIEVTNQTENSNLKIKQEKIYSGDEYSYMFQDIVNNGLSGYLQNVNSNNFVLDDMDFISKEDIHSLKSSYKYDCLTMDRDDAKFFANAIKGENYSFSVNGSVLMQNMASDVQSVQQTYKSAEVSKTLMNMLSESQSTNKPVRIDFGNDISAILRVGKNGAISAEFIPSDKVAEEYLKNNISYLQQTFEKEDIPYNELSYRQQNKNKKNQNNGSKSERGE